VSDRGRLRDPAEAPETGERMDVLASSGAWRVEQILSGRLERPVDDRLDHTEWVVVLAGSAELEVDGEAEQMGAGDWRLLRPGVPHRVLSTTPGTSWLAVHLPDGDPGGPGPRSAQ